MAIKLNKKAWIFLLSTVVLLTSCTHQFITQMPLLRHHTTILWSKKQFYKTPIFCSPDLYDGESSLIECQFSCESFPTKYRYTVTSIEDTVEFEFSKSYIQTNTDSIIVRINNESDTSSIYILPQCSWMKHNGAYLFVKDIGMNEYCSVSSTRPVHVEVYVIVDWMKENRNKTIYELLEEEKNRRLDSTIQNIR